MTASMRRATRAVALLMLAFAAAVALPAGLAQAAVPTSAVPTSAVMAGTTIPGPTAPVEPTPPTDAEGPTVSVDINGLAGKPSSSITIILAITALSVAPALLLMTTSFTKIFVVLSITRNALGLTSAPPNQVLAGISLFITLFVMGPVLTEVNDKGVQPFLAGDVSQSEAFTTGVAPLKSFMLDHTRAEDLALVTRAADRPNPKTRDDTPVLTLIPAFMLSELRAAFIIGFVIFVPFLVIDIVVSAALMSMGMMMLPPVTVALPFKLLLFVLVDGWGLVITALVGSYR